MKAFIKMLLVCLLLNCRSYSQLKNGYVQMFAFGDSVAKRGDNGYVDTVYFVFNKFCKSGPLTPLILHPLSKDSVNVALHRSIREKTVVVPVKKVPFLVVHGSITYDLYYQSNRDTPFVEKDIYQHTVQTLLDVTVKNQYPLRIAFTTNIGNSDYFRNITGLGLQYANRDFKQLILNKAKQWDDSKEKLMKEVHMLESRIGEITDQINLLRSQISSPSRLQEMVEEKERKFYKHIKDSIDGEKNGLAERIASENQVQTGYRRFYLSELRDSIGVTTLKGNSALEKVDTLIEQTSHKYMQIEKKTDSLKNELSKIQDLYNKKKEAIVMAKSQLMDVLLNSNNRELIRKLQSMDLPDSVLPKGYKNLLAIRSVGIGRTIVDYSELTAKDISIIGVQAEYNPSWYLAFATGAVDFRFRDFIVRDNRIRQYLNLIRLGVGMREGSNIILTYYTGRKQVYNFNTSSGSTSSAPDYSIMGISLEGRWQLNSNNYIIAEAAKSSLPYYASGAKGERGFQSMIGFNDRSNEAWSVKLFSFIPATSTSINALYKSMGANFQSFSLYTTGSSQNAWSIRIDQPLWHRQVTVSAGLRKNDFRSIYQYNDFHSNTIYKSIQATLRIRKWPVVSVGYFPSSQLTKISEDHYIENQFYTLTGTASHFYRYRSIMMNTMFSYTRFYNKKMDSAFLYFNTKNIALNHTMIIGKLTLNGIISAANNMDYSLYNADGNAQYRLKNWIDIGGGIKYNWQTVYHIGQLGYSANVRVRIPYLGEVALFADKGFIPGSNKRLLPSNTGRVTYTKTF
ncbi:MAG TPA: hypothetical protein VM802_19715 [Chitinophaga sp.]|uniref:hypothetical protein n=1 Tax=Chitinophaga sp. TaxID=1869181 RepID=UPI002C693251|nr:hypothetical protein [Chitinophaga sp.]HVI47114.1 hypothetical protein [Chitinophaga sp.]